MGWTFPQAGFTSGKQPESWPSDTQRLDLKRFYLGYYSGSPIYPQVIYPLSLGKCVCVCVCVCVCFGLGINCPATSGLEEDEEGEEMGPTGVVVYIPPQSVSLWTPSLTWSLSDFCWTEGSGSPCSTLCLHPIKMLSSSFHLPEMCNSLLQ